MLTDAAVQQVTTAAFTKFLPIEKIVFTSHSPLILRRSNNYKGVLCQRSFG